MALEYDKQNRFRAVRSPHSSLEDDHEEMVQQQLARLKFFERAVGEASVAALDWGCGTGFNCAWLSRNAGAREVSGFDISEPAIAAARLAVPGIAFAVADACNPSLDLQPGHWDLIISCEVIEHVPDMHAFLSNLSRHLAPGGVAFISTPNRTVFSLGHEPSPVNREHIKELALEEFAALLKPHFSSVAIYGQQFKNEQLLAAWKVDVTAKIDALNAGTRWRQPGHSPQLWEPLLQRIHKVPLVRYLWTLLRWRLAAYLAQRFTRPVYMHDDFEFVSDDLSKSVWFCAIARV